MNERIKELEKQCWDNQTNHLNAEKFAWLIVRECAGVGYDASYYECALNVSNKIKEHFGVEE
jgi:hypothetical protein